MNPVQGQQSLSLLLVADSQRAFLRARSVRFTGVRKRAHAIGLQRRDHSSLSVQLYGKQAPTQSSRWAQKFDRPNGTRVLRALCRACRERSLPQSA
jgi:hypothetical protein